MGSMSIRLTSRLASVCALAGLFLAPHAFAQVFKCVDAKGKTVYSQTPCPSGENATVLDGKPKAPSRSRYGAETPAAAEPAKPAAKDAAAKDAKPPPTPEEAFQKRQQERADEDKKAAEKTAADARKAEDCRRSKEQVAQYDIGGRIARLDEKGERYFLDENQVAAERARAQALADQNCR
jgi:hypothetical protein